VLLLLVAAAVVVVAIKVAVHAADAAIYLTRDSFLVAPTQKRDKDNATRGVDPWKKPRERTDDTSV
jgi:hypothetical protein